MNKHLIVGHFGSENQPIVSTVSGELVTLVDLLTPSGRLHHGISQTLDELKAIQVYPSEVGLDLFVLATLVHLADTRISRVVDSQDTWTREIRIVVPVLDVELWSRSQSLVQRTLNFLTGDRWSIEFCARPENVSTLVPARPLESTGVAFDGLSLFSGGLDSLIGVTNMLAAGRTPLLVSHAGEGATSDAQNACFDGMKTHYSSNSFARVRHWLNFPKDLVAGSRTENTTRGRSFLFFALGAFVGSGLTSPFALQVPENGLIAINVPMDKLRLGSLSTRTTHPFYIARWNELLTMLGIVGSIENPYWNMTKGEMARACANQPLLKQIVSRSMSCSAPTKGRWHGQSIEHCGYCLPCLIRRSALLAAWGTGADPTTYTVDVGSQVLDTHRAEGKQVRSFQYAVSRLRANPGIERILIHKPGSLADVAADVNELAAVYRRGLLEVDALVANARAVPNRA